MRSFLPAQNTNQIFSRFLPYQTNKDRSTLFWWFFAMSRQFFLAMILVFFGGERSGKNVVGNLGETMTSWIRFEFNWPLVSSSHSFMNSLKLRIWFERYLHSQSIRIDKQSQFYCIHWFVVSKFVKECDIMNIQSI